MVVSEILGTKESVYIWNNRIKEILFNQYDNQPDIIDLLNTVKANNMSNNLIDKERKGLINFLNNQNLQSISFNNKHLYATCVDITNSYSKMIDTDIAYSWYKKRKYGFVKYLSLNNETDNNIKNILLASSAIPILYNPVKIQDRIYIDGGLGDNLPIKPINDLHLKHIIVIPCGNVINAKIKAKYPHSTIYIIKPSHDLGGLFSGTLNFNREKIFHMINLGYKDGLKYAKKYKFE